MMIMHEEEEQHILQDTIDDEADQNNIVMQTNGTLRDEPPSHTQILDMKILGATDCTSPHKHEEMEGGRIHDQVSQILNAYN